MARIRYIKPEFYSDTMLSEVSILARYLYVGLFCQLDCNGLAIDDPKFLKREIYPYDEEITVQKIIGFLDELVSYGRLIRFTYEGKKYLYCPTLSKHQKFHKDEKPKYHIPIDAVLAPSQQGANRVLQPDRSGLTQELGALVTGNGELVTETNINTLAGKSGEIEFEALEIHEGEVISPEGVQTPLIEKIPKLHFEKVYEEYPRKDGKQEGLRICKARIKTSEDCEKLLCAVRRYRAHCEREGIEKQYIKHFSTFMQKDRWKDWLDPETGTAIETQKTNYDLSRFT